MARLNEKRSFKRLERQFRLKLWQIKQYVNETCVTQMTRPIKPISKMKLIPNSTQLPK